MLDSSLPSPVSKHSLTFMTSGERTPTPQSEDGWTMAPSRTGDRRAMLPTGPFGVLLLTKGCYSTITIG